MRIKRKLLQALVRAATDALELTGLECNCGEKCQKTCTYSELKAATEAVKARLVFKDEPLLALRSAFDEHTVDTELWDELDTKDEGDRINVPIVVQDLLRIRPLTERIK